MNKLNYTHTLLLKYTWHKIIKSLWEFISRDDLYLTHCTLINGAVYSSFSSNKYGKILVIKHLVIKARVLCFLLNNVFDRV